jgi:hypothetical protein
LVTYPPSITLPYRVANAWLEEQILAGKLVDCYQTFVLEPDKLDPKTRERAVTVWKHVQPHDHFVEVIGSGITDVDYFPRTTDTPNATAFGPIQERIGLQPELPAPTEDPRVLLDAYEGWIKRYIDLAGMALAVWIDEMATDQEIDEDDRLLGLTESWWQHTVRWRLSESAPRETVVDGRKNLELFQRCRGAWQAVRRARDTTDAEACRASNQIVGTIIELAKKPSSVEELVAAYEDYCERLSNIALAHFWARQQRRDNFNRQMSLWALDHGSERLRIGIADGYRMVPVYLNERISREVPGFYAYLTKDDESSGWQPRTGPSAPALQLRRAVQARLEQHAQDGETAPTATIVWMKDPPNEMCDVEKRTIYDEWGNAEGLETEPFEAVVAENWLGRYTLIAAVVSEDVVPPDYVRDEHLLDGETYGLDDLPVRLRRRSDVPVDTSDFGAPSAAPADDDIPF